MNTTPANTLDSVTGAATAITGFLRGVERRAALLAELQCGDVAHGDQALTSVIETFIPLARQAAEADWPRLFWAALLESPALASEPLAPFWRDDFAPLARLEFGPRAVLLIRLVAQLDDVQAAEVFGVDADSYRQALQRALPQRADGTPDGEIWLQLRAEARYTLEDMGPDRLAAIARAREAAVIAGQAVPPAATTTRETSLLNRAIPLSIPLRAPAWLSKLRGGARAD